MIGLESPTSFDWRLKLLSWISHGPKLEISHITRTKIAIFPIFHKEVIFDQKDEHDFLCSPKGSVSFQGSLHAQFLLFVIKGRDRTMRRCLYGFKQMQDRTICNFVALSKACIRVGYLQPFPETSVNAAWFVHQVVPFLWHFQVIWYVMDLIPWERQTCC